MEMSQATKERLRNTPKARCGICNSRRDYENPMAICFWCNKKYCFDHITCGYMRKNQPNNEELHDICDFCIKTVNAIKY